MKTICEKTSVKKRWSVTIFIISHLKSFFANLALLSRSLVRSLMRDHWFKLNGCRHLCKLFHTIHIIRLKRIIILFFRIIKFSFYLAWFRGFLYSRMRCLRKDRRLVCSILHRLVYYAFASVYFFTIVWLSFLFFHALLIISLFLVPRPVSRISRFKSNVIQRRELEKNWL